MLKEFRDFAMRGNLVDMAVGIIMGVAFGGLVNSMVNDIIMPIVGKLTGGVDFSNLFINLSGPQDQFASLKAAKDAGAATINYGLFINLVINFIIVAFGGLVNSMVNDIIMPIVGKATGGVDFSNLSVNLSGPQDQFASLKAAKDAGAATVNYGLFINLIINFIIVAFVMFLLIKGMNKMKKEAPAAAPPAPPRSEVLLAEIRDLLKK